MVLDVFVEGCDESFSCRYTGFTKFRSEIFRGWNEELGRLYEQKYAFLFDDNLDVGALGFMGLVKMGRPNHLDVQMRKILDEYDVPYNEGMKIFFYHSDCDGEITPDECKLLLKSFERVDPEKFDKSDEDINEWYRERYEIWKKMIQYAIRNNKSIIFG